MTNTVPTLAETPFLDVSRAMGSLVAVLIVVIIVVAVAKKGKGKR